MMMPFPQKNQGKRELRLKLLTANNNLLKAYFTKHTFEIDLALSGSKKYFEIIARESFEKDFYLTLLRCFPIF